MYDPMTEWAIGSMAMLMNDRAEHSGQYPPTPNKFNRTTSAKKHTAKVNKQRDKSTKRDIQAAKSQNARRK